MPEHYDYLVIGAGLAGVSAVKAIREVDEDGSILLIGEEIHAPYHRPPLTKQLWTGKKKPQEIFVEEPQYFESRNIALALGLHVQSLDASHKLIRDGQGTEYTFRRALLATGGAPRKLAIPGANLDGVCYFRNLDDYYWARNEARAGASALVIGGGFIGSELAAALRLNDVDVTLVFPDRFLCGRIFPEDLAAAVTKTYTERGVRVHAQDRPLSISRSGTRLVTQTEKGRNIVSDIVLVGIGIEPSIGLATMAGLEVGNGIVVDEQLATSNPDIFAAGDNAFFHSTLLDQSMRIEHWDNALSQGATAGRNLAGAAQTFDYQPYFFSDLFDFGYEAIGETDARLETFSDWQEEYATGAIYYLSAGKVRGVMLCNIWGKVDEAREVIRRAERATPDSLRGAIRA